MNGRNLFIDGNAELTHLALPAFRQVHIPEMSENPHLPVCEVEALFTGSTGTRRQEHNDTTATCTP